MSHISPPTPQRLCSVPGDHGAARVVSVRARPHPLTHTHAGGFVKGINPSGPPSHKYYLTTEALTSSVPLGGRWSFTNGYAGSGDCRRADVFVMYVSFKYFFLRTFKLMFDVIKLRLLRIRSGRLSNTTRPGCAWTLILRRAGVCKSRSSVAMVRRYLPSMFTTNSICLTAATYYQ